MVDEARLVAALSAAFPRFAGGLGIGDDAAIVAAEGNLVATTDLLLEDVDFTAGTEIEHVMAKSLAANFSDVAAMGASPFAFLLTLGLNERALGQFDRLVSALASRCRSLAVDLIGGDLSSAEKFLVSITAFGRFKEGARPLLRSAAQPGQRIFVSRPIGGAAAGLALLRNGWTIDASGNATAPGAAAVSYAQKEFARSALLRQVDPEPEISLGMRLGSLDGIGACIDLSDGLSSDLSRLCQASRCGAVIERERIPAFPDLAANAYSLGIRDPLAAVLHGGEDYALLFTASWRESELSRVLGRPVYAVGQVVEGDTVILRSGSKDVALEALGFDHFAER